MKKKWFAGLVLAGVFLLGGLIGTTGTLWVLKSRIPHFQPVEPIYGPDQEPHIRHVLGRMKTQLDLSDSQVEAIRAEMRVTARDFRSLHSDTGERMRDILQHGIESIKHHLTPAQIKRYEEEIAKRREHHRRFMNHMNHQDGRKGFPKHRGSDHEEKGEPEPDFPPPPPPE